MLRKHRALEPIAHTAIPASAAVAGRATAAECHAACRWSYEAAPADAAAKYPTLTLRSADGTVKGPGMLFVVVPRGGGTAVGIIAIRGTAHGVDYATDVALARGKLSYTARANQCRLFARRVIDGLRVVETIEGVLKVTSITFTGHSLGGALAIDLLRSALCEPAWVDVSPAVIAFNPGWLTTPPHYALAGTAFYGRITVLHMKGDRLSAAATGALTRRGADVHVITGESTATQKAHKLAAFGPWLSGGAPTAALLVTEEAFTDRAAAAPSSV